MERFYVLLVLWATLGVRVALAMAAEEFPTKEFVAQLRPVVEKCEEQTGVDKDLVEQFSKGANMVDDPKLKCYMKCMFLELDVLNPATGVFRYEKMLNQLPEEMKRIAYDMGNKCIHLIGDPDSDMCQLSFDLHRCWQRADPEHYFLM